MRQSHRFACLTFVCIASLVILVVVNIGPSNVDHSLSIVESKSVFLLTARGNVTYEEVNERVFQPMGFEMIEKTKPIPKLRYIEQPQCETIFVDWLKIASSGNQKIVPPKEIPAQIRDVYILNGYALHHSWYMDDRSSSVPIVFDQIPKWLNSDPHSYRNYDDVGISIYHAMQNHRLDGLSGFVIGSLTPWVEVFALKAGAKKILSVDYQNISIVGSDAVKYLHALSFADQWKERSDSFDFAASFSSIEHSGLQRYGDAADPIGDLREVMKVRCFLKTGGLFFLGLPRGQDQLVYNVHRVYGRIRLAMMFAGFELIAVYRNDNPSAIILTNNDFDGQTDWKGYNQDLFVLRKM